MDADGVLDGDDYEDWVAEGSAFGPAPARHGQLSNRTVAWIGADFVNTFRGGDAPTGTLTSPEFVISGKSIRFLIGGGNLPDETGLRLVVRGEVVRRSTGF